MGAVRRGGKIRPLNMGPHLVWRRDHLYRSAQRAFAAPTTADACQPTMPTYVLYDASRQADKYYGLSPHLRALPL